MLEVAVGVEVEADQNRDDLRVGHHALPAAFRGVRRGRKGVFCHLREFGIRDSLKKLNRQLEKVADSFGNITDI